MTEKLRIGILYLSLHNQLTTKFGINSLITRKEFFCKLGKHYFVPNHLRHKVIKEMEFLKMIEVVNRDSIKILRLDINIEENTPELYNLVGICLAL